MAEANSKSIDHRINHIVSELFQVEISSLSSGSSRDTIAAWDSLQHLSLVLALEEEFQIELEPEQIDAMESLGYVREAVIDCLKDKRQSTDTNRSLA